MTEGADLLQALTDQIRAQEAMALIAGQGQFMSRTTFFNARGNVASLGMEQMPHIATNIVSSNPQAASAVFEEEAARLREQTKQMDFVALFAQEGLDSYR